MLREQDAPSAILLMILGTNMLLIELIVVATNECTTFDYTPNFWLQICQFNYLKKNEPSPEPKDPKAGLWALGNFTSQYVASKDNRRDISLMIPRTHLLLIALIVGATNERTTVDNSRNLWMKFQQLVRFVFKTLINYANSAISLAISLGFC